ASVMGHGDDRWLRVPPRRAPTQVVVLVVKNEGGAGERAAALAAELRGSGLRVELDARDISFGRRAVDWEIKGVPVRVEIGPRDVAAGEASLVRRDKGDKQNASIDGLAARVVDVLEESQANLHQ